MTWRKERRTRSGLTSLPLTSTGAPPPGRSRHADAERPASPEAPNSRRRPPRSHFVILLALLASFMAYAAGAAGVAHVRDAAASDDTLRPTMPRRLRLAEATSTTLTLSWRRSNDNVGVVGYDVHVASRPAIQTTETTYTIPSLACRTTYRVGVAAYDAAGNRSRSASISVSTAARASARRHHHRHHRHHRRYPRHHHHRRLRRRITNHRPSRSFRWGRPHRRRSSSAGRRARQRRSAPLQRLPRQLGSRFRSGEDRRDDCP